VLKKSGGTGLTGASPVPSRTGSDGRFWHGRLHSPSPAVAKCVLLPATPCVCPVLESLLSVWGYVTNGSVSVTDSNTGVGDSNSDETNRREGGRRSRPAAETVRPSRRGPAARAGRPFRRATAGKPAHRVRSRWRWRSSLVLGRNDCNSRASGCKGVTRRGGGGRGE
jgi:hypothetical protein